MFKMIDVVLEIMYNLIWSIYFVGVYLFFLMYSLFVCMCL